MSPISTLISVSDRVRAGDLTARVPKQEQIEEFDYLAQSFNRMTSQIEQQRDELISANRQLDHRRRLTETVLEGVTAGVVGVDSDGNITLANSAAEEMFEAETGGLIDQNINKLLPELSELLDKAYERPNKIAQAEVPYTTRDNRKLTFILRIAIELIGETEYGAVLTFDDITELQSAQRKAAWADVARRIAHEIKNPLTPIQLSAERLKRKYLSEIKTDPETFEICTDTIIRHVGDIGRMVSEFSDFARMPEPSFKPTKLIAELYDLATFQNSAHNDIEISLSGNALENKNHLISCDAQQIRQALTNLIQNAVDSIQSRTKKEPKHIGKIDIIFHEDQESLCVVVTDNGQGLPKNEDPSSLSEPYITHRDKGTGLGLAIVKKIMTDHGGTLVIGGNDKIKSIPNWQDIGGATVAFFLSYDETVEQKHSESKKKRA